MKELVTNDYNLKESDITEVVKRVKIFLINSNNEILLGYSHNEYHCPGGHVEENEDLISAINREVKEETGIELNIKDIEPFLCSYGYYKDWPSIGKNRKTEIYFYEVKTDEKPQLDKTSYTDHEKDGNFELRYISLDKIEEEFISNRNKYGDEHGIAKEMLRVFKVYKDR